MTVPANGAPQEGATGPTGEGQAPAGQNDQQGQEPANDGQPDLSKIEDPNLRAWVEAQAKSATEARREAAKYRTERNALQQAQETARLAALPQEQQAQEAQALRDAENGRLKAELADFRVAAPVREAAVAAKAYNPEIILAMIKDKVETDETGLPTNVAVLLADLRRTDGYLFKRAATADAGAGKDNKNGSSADMNASIRALLGRGPSNT